ncbi:hypothetical protein K227x_24080 [Rubripirellula lacrimiformis]|uniref:Uncharacterized protein n=1 Tax=Rubripirellula lacrimiformis TaxID=1930273 RepID=A0A517NA63_9BACT|nr:hypothetical protein [Rubripirellula lacrimiformis]QDT04022.1 hypothetical protein K227x_24080 [Rubripirellula lacrimiformis]
MTDRSIETQGNPNEDGAVDQSPVDPHADKYNDPRAVITGRGIAIGVLVAILAVLGTWASIRARKTKLEETTRFWGQDVITALQIGERMELISRGNSDFETVDLTATPGLGHLRRALLDERHFDWTTETAGSVADMCPAEDDPKSPCIQLRLTDPTGHRFEPVEIDIALDGGWVGPSDGSKRVQATDWVQPKLRNYFATIMSVQQKRFDLRD